MRDLTEHDIVQLVFLRMALPARRPHLTVDQIVENMDWALENLKPFVPLRETQDMMQERFFELMPTEQECLQAWALYLDYHTMKRNNIVRFKCENEA